MPHTFRDKVEWLLRYCAQYASHDLMFDERVDVVDQFNVDLGIETQILSQLDGKRVILLTGDAGDGKTRVLKNLQGKLDDKWVTINDMSELDGDSIKTLLEKIRDILNLNETVEKIAVAANTGILLNSISKYSQGLELELKRKKDLCLIMDFNKRNLAMESVSEDVFKKIIREFFSLKKIDSCKTCILKDSCVFISNIHAINNEEVQSNLKFLYHVLFLRGVHITFRDLLSSLAYLVTAGIDCDQLLSRERGDDESLAYYNNLFDFSSDNIVLNAFADLDIAKNDIDRYDMEYYYSDAQVQKKTAERLLELARIKRRLFFEKPESLLKYLSHSKKNRYDLLPLEFLGEYDSLLNKLKKNKHLDSVDDTDETLQKLEMGLNKISDPYCTNSQMVLYDSPPLTSNDIQLVYTVDKVIHLLFCTPTFFFNNGLIENISQEILEDLRDIICVVFDEEIYNKERDLRIFPTLAIDYNLFREILFASHNTFRQTNAKLSENAYIVAYTKQIFKMITDVDKFSIVWVNAKRNSTNLQVSIVNPSVFSKNKNIKFQISR